MGPWIDMWRSDDHTLGDIFRLRYRTPGLANCRRTHVKLGSLLAGLLAFVFVSGLVSIVSSPSASEGIQVGQCMRTSRNRTRLQYLYLIHRQATVSHPGPLIREKTRFSPHRAQQADPSWQHGLWAPCVVSWVCSCTLAHPLPCSDCRPADSGRTSGSCQKSSTACHRMLPTLRFLRRHRSQRGIPRCAGVGRGVYLHSRPPFAHWQ